MKSNEPYNSFPFPVNRCPVTVEQVEEQLWSHNTEHAIKTIIRHLHLMTDDQRSTLFRAVLKAGASRPPVKGQVFERQGLIFLEREDGPVFMLEVRGFGADLPQDAIAEHICQLWNTRQKAEAW